MSRLTQVSILPFDIHSRFLVTVGVKKLDPTEIWPFTILANSKLPIYNYVNYYQTSRSWSNPQTRAAPIITQLARKEFHSAQSSVEHEYIVATVYPSIVQLCRGEGKTKLVFERTTLRGRGFCGTVSQIVSFITGSSRALNLCPDDTVRLWDKTRDKQTSTLAYIKFPILVTNSKSTDKNEHEQASLPFWRFIVLIDAVDRLLGDYNTSGHNCHFFSSAIMGAIERITGRHATLNNLDDNVPRRCVVKKKFQWRVPVIVSPRVPFGGDIYPPGYCHGIGVQKEPTEKFHRDVLLKFIELCLRL